MLTIQATEDIRSYSGAGFTPNMHAGMREVRPKWCLSSFIISFESQD